MGLLAVDTETTGIDLRHGAKPYMVTICNEQEVHTTFEWLVDPVTREPEIPAVDLLHIGSLLSTHDLVLHNSKFDVTALHTIMPDFKWPWDRTQDTLIAGHLLASNHKHNLTDMAEEYLDTRIEEAEIAMKEAVLACKKIVKKEYPHWQLAKEGLPSMPSAKTGSKRKEKGTEDETPWKFDTWLPRCLARKMGLAEDHSWYTVSREYADIDSLITMRLWKCLRKHIEHRRLGPIYRERMKVLPVAYRIEECGVTLNSDRLDGLVARYTKESREAKARCLEIANTDYGFDLQLPKGASPNNSLREFCFDHLKLPPMHNPKGATEAPSLKKEIMEAYTLTLEGRPLEFITNILDSRSRDTAVAYMTGYERFWVSVDGESLFRLHPFLNPTGTHTLRWSSNNPNEQNISKKDNFNLRYCFGPGEGREWWSCDAQNIELRLPAYEAGETEMLQLFERPNDPPYFGSNHLLVSHILHPEKFEECKDSAGVVDGRIFKKKYAGTLYQWVKNGNFAVQYGAVEASGTADRAYHVKGGQRRISSRFNKIAELNKKCILHAKRYGYVETIPDRTVDPHKGYPLLCTRTAFGGVLETVPLNYRIQGTACWWMQKAMVRVDELLGVWRSEGFDAHIVLQVHDELVMDLPKRAHPKTNPKGSNLPRIRKIQALMAKGGDDIGIPTPVSAEFHPITWSEGISC